MTTNSMYVVVVTAKKLAPLNDLMALIIQTFPNDKFAIVGSEDAGYQFRVLGTGDEKAPRKIAEPFLKKWQPSPEQLIEAELVAKNQSLHAKMQKADDEYFARNPRDAAASRAMDEKLKTVPGTGQPTRYENPPTQVKRKRGRPPKIKVYETLNEPIVIE